MTAYNTPVAANDSGKADAEAWAWYERQTTTTKDRALKRLSILQEVEALYNAGSTKAAAIQSVAKKYRISTGSIANWFALVRGITFSNRLPRLAPKYKGGGKKTEIDAMAWQVLKTDYLRPERPSFAACYRRVLICYAEPRGITLPHMATLRRRMDREISLSLKRELRGGKKRARNQSGGAAR